MQAQGVQQCGCHTVRKLRSLGRLYIEEAFCLWLGFSAVLSGLAAAGFILLPRLCLSSRFERGHPVSIRVHIKALTLSEERQPIALKCVIIFLLQDDSHAL